MDELEREADQARGEQAVSASEKGAGASQNGIAGTDSRPDARKALPGNRRLIAALLTCFVVALIALGVWAVQSVGGSAALSTVAAEETKAEGGKGDAAQAQSGGQQRREVASQASSAKSEQQAPAPHEQAEQPRATPVPQPAPASDSASATQDSPAQDPVVTTTVVEEPVPAPEAASVPEPAPESSAAVAEPASAPEPAPAPEPATAPESAPAPEPSAMTIRVSVDGTPAGGGYRDSTVTLAPGANVYDALLATGAGVNARGSVYGTYVAAIDGLAEKDHGGMSGWVYAVNGVEPQTACSNYTLSDGDVVAWLYVNAEH